MKKLFIVLALVIFAMPIGRASENGAADAITGFLSGWSQGIKMCLDKYGKTVEETLDEFKKSDGTYDNDGFNKFIKTECTGDQDGDEVADYLDNCPLRSNPDQNNNVCSGDPVKNLCTKNIRDEIDVEAVQKKIDEKTSEFAFYIYSPAENSIASPSVTIIAEEDDSSWKASKKLAVTCSKNTSSDVKKATASPLWGGTEINDLSGSPSYICAIKGDLKGTEDLLFTFDYKQKDGSCGLAFGNHGEMVLSAARVLTNETPTGSSDASGGDCSLNVAASTHGFGWLIDMLVLGLPAVLVGRRRNKIQ